MSYLRIAVVGLALLLPLAAFAQTSEDTPKEVLALREVLALSKKVQELVDSGKFGEAFPLAQKAVELSEKLDVNYRVDLIGITLNHLAMVNQGLGKDVEAESLFRRVLSFREEALGPDDPMVAQSLNNLGDHYKLIGDYAKAKALLERALSIHEKNLGGDHPQIAFVLRNLAFLYQKMGDYTSAISLRFRALKIHEQALGRDDPRVAQNLTILGELYIIMENYAKAESMFERALEIMKKAFGPEHPATAGALGNLGALHFFRGEYEKALSIYQQVLAIHEKAGTGEQGTANARFNLAAQYHTMRNYAKAEPLYRRALGIIEKADQDSIVDYLPNLADLEVAQQNYSSAFASYKRVISIEDKEIPKVFAVATEEQKLEYTASISGHYSKALSIIYQYLRDETKAVRDGLELVLRRKGIVFDAQSRAREALQGRLSEAARKDWEKLSSLRSELARLLLNRPKKMSPEAYQDKIGSLQQQIEAVEKRLTDESALVAKELKQRTITVEVVAKALPKGSVLVEFVSIRDFDFAQWKRRETSRYLAFVLTASGEVTLVDLGDADELEKLARLAMEHIQASMRAPQKSQQSLQALYQRVWAPLKDALKNADKVILSPDGQLNLVPFAALLDDQGRPLVEQYRLAYVTSGRELIAATGAPIPPDSDLVLVANPAYDKKGTAAGNPGASRRSRNFRGSFDPLPGTELEAKAIPPLVSGKKDKKRVVVGAEATESAVMAARSPRILHLATHGFFLEDEELMPDEKQRGQKGSAMKYENPLVRSGLAFAGANHAAESTGGDDGILTALEITAMDLYGTELVVLSACETGVGEVKNGEGVYGLRRAFALAGAKNLMMSLWPVSDEITAGQMKAFYKNLQSMPPAEALHQAQLATITELKAKFGGQAPPVLWAPFFLQGAQALGQ